MAIIAPWLQLPNFMQSAESGARIGLSQAQLEQEERLKNAELAQRASEAVRQNALGFAQVNSQNQRSANELAAAKLHQNALLPIEQAKVKNAGDRIASEDLFHTVSNKLRQNELLFRQGKLTVDQKMAADRLAQQADAEAGKDERQQNLIASRTVKTPAVPKLESIEIPVGNPVTKPGTFWGTNTTPAPTSTIKNVPINDPMVNLDPKYGGAPGFGTNYTGAAAALMNPSPAAPAAPSNQSPAYKSPDEVKSAFTAGSLSKEDAAKILKTQFGFE